MHLQHQHHQRRVYSKKYKQQLLKDIQQATCIIEDRLYFTVTKCPRNTSNIHMFSIDNVLRYEPFFVDFGPLNLACLYKFCKLVNHKLNDKKYKNHRLFYYCDRSPQRISNACYLIGCYQVIELGKDPSYAYNTIHNFAMQGAPFRDASMGICSYRCTARHCIFAVYRSLQNKFLDFNGFDVDEYEHFERVECGDLNTIIPQQFIAFAGPYYKEFDQDGYPALTADFYLPIWKKFGVKIIIRLNKKCYDKRIFTRAGYEHHDLYFIDGTTPSLEIINRFLSICENATGVLAVHCKAGLGRTGSCIGCYLMKHYCWTAQEVIAWLRVCRPGSVIGPQQHFLQQMQPIMWKAGDKYRASHKIRLKNDPRDDAHDVNQPHRVSNSNSNSGSASKSRHAARSKHSSNSNSNSEGRAQRKEYVKRYLDSKPLPTDPGQNQGQALRDAKRKIYAINTNNNNNKDVTQQKKDLFARLKSMNGVRNGDIESKTNNKK